MWNLLAYGDAIATYQILETATCFPRVSHDPVTFQCHEPAVHSPASQSWSTKGNEGKSVLFSVKGGSASRIPLPKGFIKTCRASNGAICVFRKFLASQRSAAGGDSAPTLHPSLAPTLQRKNRKEGGAGAVGKPCTCPCRGPRLAGAEPCGCGQMRHNRSRCGRSQGLGGVSLTAGGEDPGRCGTPQQHSWRGPGTLSCGPEESWNVRTRP